VAFHTHGTQGSSISQGDPIQTKLQRAHARAGISDGGASSSSLSKRTKRKKKQKKAAVGRKKQHKDHTDSRNPEGDAGSNKTDSETDSDDEASGRLNEKCFTPRRRAFIKAAKRMARARAAMGNAFPTSFERHDFDMETLAMVAELGEEYDKVWDYLLLHRTELRAVQNLVRSEFFR
jgi:hypothetical protein